jgi:AmiR/NasT family two-component response regulator
VRLGDPGQRADLRSRGPAGRAAAGGLSTRGVLNQAAGVLIAQRHCSADEAFHLLAAAAQRNRLTVEEVAADLVERTSTGG